MKVSKLLSLITMFGVAWYFLKSKKSEKINQPPSALSSLVTGIKDEIKKPLNQIDDDLPSHS